MIHLYIMKKYFSIFAMAMLLLLTACGNDEPSNESTSIMIMYNRAVNIDNSNVTFSQSNNKFILRSTGSSSIQAQMILKIDENTTVEFDTDFMPLVASGDEAYTYTFSGSSATAGTHTVSNIRGKINLVGPTYMEYLIDGKYQCYSTLQPYYTHTSTIFTRTQSDGPVEFNVKDIYYGLQLDNTGKKGSLYLFNFHVTETGSSLYCLSVEDLTAEATPTGYHLTGTDIVPKSNESAYDTHGSLTVEYKMKSVDLQVTEQGQCISGTIITDNEETPMTFNLNGRFFEINY